MGDEIVLVKKSHRICPHALWTPLSALSPPLPGWSLLFISSPRRKLYSSRFSFFLPLSELLSRFSVPLSPHLSPSVSSFSASLFLSLPRLCWPQTGLGCAGLGWVLVPSHFLISLWEESNPGSPIVARKSSQPSRDQWWPPAPSLPQGAERKMRDDERKQFRRKVKCPDSSNSGQWAWAGLGWVGMKRRGD